MSNKKTQIVTADDDDIRLDRWFKRHYPDVSFGQVSKMIRKGDIRLDGVKVAVNTRIKFGQEIRMPPFMDALSTNIAPKKEHRLSKEDEAFIQSLVIYKDEDVIALNKPSGIAVQGGSKTHRHIDGLLDGLKFGREERPRLCHRLDRDTSGVLVLARSAGAAAKLTKAFRDKDARKVYWGLVSGVPRPNQGMIDMPLVKEKAQAGESFRERSAPASPGQPGSKKAITYYSVVARAGQSASWLAMMPLTGRTHQLRVHCAEIGHPLLGDRKYGGEKAEVSLTGEVDGAVESLQLHAHSLDIAHPKKGRLQIVAPLRDKMAENWGFLDFDTKDDGDPFAELQF